MWNKIKTSVKNNKPAFITGITLLLSLGVIIAITAAANRSRRGPGELEQPSESTTSGTLSTLPTTTSDATSATSSTSAPTTSATRATSSAAQAADEPPTLVLPVSGAMQKGHDLTLQVFSNTMQDYRVHNGIDIASTLGSPVYAAADGKVTKIWEDISYGTCIEVSHAGDCVSYYKNISPILAEGISVDAAVKQGQLIAAVGESSMVEIADEPHLHFELKVDGEFVDPTEYFDSASVAILDKDTAYHE